MTALTVFITVCVWYIELAVLFCMYITFRDHFRFIRHWGGRYERNSSYGMMIIEILAVVIIPIIWYIIIFKLEILT